MSVKNLGFPLPVKIEEDQKLFIDLDTEGNSPEDIVIEWHLEIRRFFGSYAAASGEIKLISIMKEYIIAITERAIHFEDIVRLHEMVEHHMEHIYWFYRDSDICFSDMYLDYMEHILTFYVNLTLRVLLVLKKKIKVTQKKVNDMTQKVIKRLSFYLLKSEYHIFHVLIRQTTTQVDGMIKDVMNILNSNICKQMFRNLYMHFLVLTPVKDMSDEAFCRAFILFENWKAFEDYKQNEKIDECIRNIFNRDVRTIRENEFLSGILTPKTSIISELMRVMGCDPSITKAYFDHIKSKQKVDGEILDDISKLAIEDTILVDAELVPDEEDDDSEYIEYFNQIMGEAKYDLNEVVLDCKNERNYTEAASVTEDAEILVLDTDSDSDVEIVSIIPSQNSSKRSTPTRRSRNTAANSQPVTSFLESISVDVDTARRKYGFRTFGNIGNSQKNNTSEVNQISTTTATPTVLSNSVEESSVNPTNQTTETCLIIDDDVCEEVQNNSSVTEEAETSTEKNVEQSVTNTAQAESLRIESSKTDSRKETSKTDSVVSSLIEDPSPSISNTPPEVPMEAEVSETPSIPDCQSIILTEKIVDDTPKMPEVSSSSSTHEEGTSSDNAPSAISEETTPSPEVPSGTNGTVNHVCRCSQMIVTPVVSENEETYTEVLPAISSTTPEKVKVVVEIIPPLEEFSKNIRIEEMITQEMVTYRNEDNDTIPDANITAEVGADFERLRIDPAEVVVESIDTDTIPSEPVQSQEGVEDESALSTIVSETSNLKLTPHEQNMQLDTPSEPSKDVTLFEPQTEFGSSSDKEETTVNENSVQCQYEELIDVSNCNLESEILECRTEPPSDCNSDQTILTNKIIDCVGSVINVSVDETVEHNTPIDTGQHPFVEHLDTGQFDPNSPASPEPVEIAPKSPDGKNGKILTTVSESLLRKEQHGEFGYPTPPGSEEEREKDSDEPTELIYSNILPTKNFGVEQTSHDYDADQVLQLTPNNVQDDRDEHRDPSPSLGECYEQIVKDAVGSQNSTEDEDEVALVPEKSNLVPEDEEGHISFDEMEQFLKNCGNEDYSQTNRKKRKRPREKTIVDDGRSRKNSCGRSPKRVKINDKPETHFIPSSYDKDSEDDVWNQKIEYESSSSSDNEDASPNRLKIKRKPSPMPLSKYLTKRNGTSTHIPLSGRSTPDKPPPLKGILKRIEQKHTYHPLHPVDDEPETVVIVLHQRDIGRGKRGSVEVKVYRKSFTAYKIPFDDHKLCHLAVVEMEGVKTDDVNYWGKVSDRTRVYEEELYNQPEKPMYKIVFDKKTPQLNSNDRKYYCDPSISSGSSKRTLTESKHEQGTVNLTNEFVYIETPEPESTIQPPPISPPCFSPSSNSSSEFSDPTNLIPYQDIERALQVVEPDKSEGDEQTYRLERPDSEVLTEKSIVDRIAMETIELLSNNADFHKMLRNLNKGGVLIENVPVLDASCLENVVAVTECDDLVSNLNSDEQLLKKVCQELESKALVDNLVPQNRMTDELSLIESCPKEILPTEEQQLELDCSEVVTDRICYPTEHVIQVSSFSTVPISYANSLPVAYSTTNMSVLHLPVETSTYSSPVVATIPNAPLHYTPASELPLVQSFPSLSSPTFPPKLSPIIPTLSPFHPELYYPSNLPNYSDRNYSAPKPPKISPIPNSHHQQVYPSVPSLPVAHPGYKGSKSPLQVNSSSVIPLVQVNGQDPRIIHPGYSHLNGSSQLQLQYNSSKSFISNPSGALHVYPEGNRLLRTAPSSVLSYTQPNSSIPPPQYTTNIDPNSYILPSYPEPNCLITNVPNNPSFSERKMIVPSPPLNVPTYSNTIRVTPNNQSAHLYRDPIPTVASTSKCSSNPEPRSLRSSCKNPPKVNTNVRNRHPSKTQSKTDKRKSRLPKEVLTISEINAAKSITDWSDNNSKTNPSVYAPLDLQRKTGNSVSGIDRKEAEPMVGRPLNRPPSPHSEDKELNLNVPVKRKAIRKLVRKRCNSVSKKRRIAHHVQMRRKPLILRIVARKSLSRARKVFKLESSQLRKAVEPVPRVVSAAPATKTSPNKLAFPKAVSRQTNLPLHENNKLEKHKTPRRKRGRPPKNAKAIEVRADEVERYIPSSAARGSHPVSNERVPKTHQTEVRSNKNAQLRVEPLKIIKDPNSKSGHTRFVAVSCKAPPQPSPVPKVAKCAKAKEIVSSKPSDSSENDVEFETHLPLKKRKLSMPVQSAPHAQATTLANVPRTRARKDDISYPATPMLSIADVYMQPRTFKTPAEKKQLPPESTTSVPMRYQPQPDPQFNCGLNAYPPAMYGFGKCPYSIELDCNPYCPPPVLFPPESFSRTN